MASVGVGAVALTRRPLKAFFSVIRYSPSDVMILICLTSTLYLEQGRGKIRWLSPESEALSHASVQTRSPKNGRRTKPDSLEEGRP